MMRVGLRQRYALIIALAAVVVASLVQVISYWETTRLAKEVERSSSDSMSRALRREAGLAARQLASVLAASLVEPLEKEDFERLFNITHSARSLPDVTEVLVYDRDGKVIHDGTKEIDSYGASAPDGLRTLVLSRGQTLSKFEETTLDICVPILTTNRIIGAVRYTISLSRFEAHMRQLDGELAAINQRSADKHLRNFIGLVVVLIILGAVVGITAAGRLIEPIQALTAMTRQVAQRNFRVNVPERRPDELGELASSLKRMAAEIEESMISRSHLEEEVRNRTVALERANRELEQRDHHRRHFLAEVSHELRTPLTIIHGEAQVAARMDDDDIARYQHSFATIIEQSTSMRTLVDDLLKLARLDDHLTEYNFEHVQVAELVDAAVMAAQRLVGAGNLWITTDNRQDDIAIHGDRQKLGQFLLIFVKNSINYSPEGGRIEIRSQAQGDTAEILISDQGVGLEPLDQERIFDPFYRGKKARQLFPNGSGLGLSIARKILDAHRGTICVANRADRGTTVSIKLPLESRNGCQG
ncbi:MAG: HAMP domain-containing histidine kinase [Alphaproteobacteria bacterium]|nr:HAMP domain-containing histidine kinase [Alphaproteobacteria bacterium]